MREITYGPIRIAGIHVATPMVGGVSVSKETIWSAKTGRSVNGKMVGDIIARKTTVTVKWGPLPYPEVHRIRKAIEDNGPFFELIYPDYDGTNYIEKRITCYAGAIPWEIYSTNRKYRMITGLTITFIEQ